MHPDNRIPPSGAADVAEVKALSLGEGMSEKDRLMSEALPIGTIVQGFRITRVIRPGRSNNVYVAVSASGQEVAMKEFFPRSLCKRMKSGRIGVQNEKLRSQFEAGMKGFITEAVALAEIKSDLLAKYVAAFRDNGTAFLMTLMEPGETLEEYVRRIMRAKVPGKELPSESDLRLIFWMLLNALKVMHDQGFLHLDIKPPNVIMRDEFTPVLIDLGGARTFPLPATVTAPSVSNYTPGFAALEQHEERAAQLCPATDIYGVGASLFYCMTGRVPKNAAERKLNDEETQSIFRRCENRYSRQMVDVVRKSMALDIEDRYLTIEAVQNDISSQ